ncbi:tRNA 4-thiouridine(8) synthase ThiI [Tumebacillus sp. ITR2]|uniref:Probable tRNA sulfurtransferase n=1 Tax=Tumebacillus amylolyticus TaxID=2801339 RepID=A0ABS1JD50_9BACL|nr:tRNA uracil 4-sulfurtransferase ThiI [Tumebacillus amylolyticus]MBL0388173.1 tRNA 4-thiouridine(8) synthase ThiI [Tumebacillus amylolyticus]
MYSTLIARLGGEIAIKGKNRSHFEKMLMENMRGVVKSLGVKVAREGGRIEVRLNGADMDETISRLKNVFGINSLSPVAEVELDIEKIKESALLVVQDALSKRTTPVTFKVEARRANKRFPMESPEIAQEVGRYVLSRTEGALKVDVHKPELRLMVEVRESKAYLTCDVIPGPGGLPVGTSGRVLLLLSGGIDSPVAGYLTLKRGAILEAIHFHSFPFTSERAQEKVNDLAKMLAQHGGRIRLHNVYFTEIQRQIRMHCPEEYSVTIMRRIMMRIADRLAHERKCLALVTGESLGQVASQTLESMYTINNVTNIPILRPLVAMDKVDIMDIARRIGTYETSILPFEDCCTIFLPKNPKTRPKLHEAQRAEEKLDIEALITEALEKTETLLFTRES